MELKEFIKESLVQINQAIEESNEELKDSEAIINPKGVQINSENSQAYGRQSYKSDHHDYKVVQKIDFDVAVYAENDQKAGGGAKISIASISIGANGEVNYTNKSESRLRFSIPVIYPEGKWEI
jgi:ribosome-associated protein YbcJ (S4-like RNA binding protein)